jgi:CRP-like cAMP-binding protein
MRHHSEAIEAALNELGAFPIFYGRSKEEILELCEGGQIVNSAHRECLFQYGDHAAFFGLILSGAYKLSCPSVDGEDAIMHFATPGELLAVFVLTQSNPRFPVTATSIGSSRLLKLPRETYLNGWKRYPDQVFKVQEMLAMRLCLLHGQRSLIKAPLAQKVAFLLTTLAQKSSNSLGIITPTLTRKEIAESWGSSVESVIRIMSDWTKQGFIRTEAQEIQILQPEKLIELSIQSIRA